MPVLAQIKKVGTSPEELYYFYNDDQGSKRAAIKASTPTEVEVFEYTAFGEVIIGSEDKAAFTGKQLDATGLYYFNARYYDPEVKRFLTQDPAKQGSGWYTYCANNPINLIDPDGRRDIEGTTLDNNYTVSERLAGKLLNNTQKIQQERQKDIDNYKNEFNSLKCLNFNNVEHMPNNTIVVTDVTYTTNNIKLLKEFFNATPDHSSGITEGNGVSPNGRDTLAVQAWMDNYSQGRVSAITRIYNNNGYEDFGIVIMNIWKWEAKEYQASANIEKRFETAIIYKIKNKVKFEILPHAFNYRPRSEYNERLDLLDPNRLQKLYEHFDKILK